MSTIDIIKKLDKCLHHNDGVKLSVSPTLVLGKTPSGAPGTLYKGLCVEALSQNDLILVHVNLHRFYPQGIHDFKREDIEQLHKRVKRLVNHVRFDQLDDIE